MFGYFDSLKGHEVEHLINVLKVKRSNLSFDLIIVGLDFSEQRSSQSRSKIIEYEMLSLVNIHRDLGKVFISPESFADKISEFFNPIEIDFPEDKAFSDKYYVLSGDAGKVKNNLDAGLRIAISNFDNLYLECSGTKMIIRVQDEISVENTKSICHAAFNILRA
jgi:predicted MPP superfamily phosphohydrolase